MKKLFGALAAIVLALMLYAPPAEARCWWNGFRWHCNHPYYGRYWAPYRPYAYYPFRYRHYYYRPRAYAWGCTWRRCW